MGQVWMMIILATTLFSLNKMKRLFLVICRVTNFAQHMIELRGESVRNIPSLSGRKTRRQLLVVRVLHCDF